MHLMLPQPYRDLALQKGWILRHPFAMRGIGPPDDGGHDLVRRALAAPCRLQALPLGRGAGDQGVAQGRRQLDGRRRPARLGSAEAQARHDRGQ